MPNIASAGPFDPARSSQFSNAVGIARVMCILGIVYVHAWTGLPGAALAELDGAPQGILRWGLMELLGRSAVPLLGMISGWLVAGSVRKRPWRAFVTDKARTILAPMIVWNALAIVFVSGAAYFGLLQAPLPTSWWETIDELFCLATPNEINVQMSFLRDIFLCMVAAPLLARLPRWALIAIAMATLAWIIAGTAFPLFLRPSIPFFFIIGMLARRGDGARSLATRPIAIAALPYGALALTKIWLETVGMDAGVDHPSLLIVVDMLLRFAAALFFWSIAWRLASSRAAVVLLRIEPYAFLMFCAHLVMIWLAGPLIGKLTGPLGSPAYPPFLLLQPLLVLLATIGLGRALVNAAPGLTLLLSGGRLKPTARSSDGIPIAEGHFPSARPSSNVR